MNTRIRMAEFLCCPPETITTTLLINYTSTQNKKFIKREKNTLKNTLFLKGAQHHITKDMDIKTTVSSHSTPIGMATGAKRGPFTWHSNHIGGKEMTIHIKVLFKLTGNWSI